jgi:Ser/Thr protein kinase RdoA (MazF antagonist)
LNLVSAKDGTDYYIDRNNNYWRIYRFITDAVSFDLVRRPEDFYQSGLAFGHFQRMLADYPAEELFETIPDFHNTPKRYADFCRAVEEDAAGRVSGVKREIEFFMERHEDYDMAVREHREGSLPLRVTHNDTKLNNIMIDSRTGQALCIIDLDTVMPGFSIFDFGDSIRFGANTAEEDERDLGKVSFSIMLYETYCRGFLRGCAGSLTKTELEMLPQGARLMTLECGMRFLADYLQGDIYFRTDREGQNLDRARTQIAMTADMEKKWEEMSSVTRETAAAVTADGR